MKLYLSGEKIGVSIVEKDIEEAFGKFGKLGNTSRSLIRTGLRMNEEVIR
jgi:hypothetical protein